MEKYADAVEAALADLDGRDVVERMWRHDHTVWKPEPAEIANCLGWLTVTDLIRQHLFDLDTFVREVRETGFRHVVLLGMGGGSLGTEVLRQVLKRDIARIHLRRSDGATIAAELVGRLTE